jgi:hypothetical protein
VSTLGINEAYLHLKLANLLLTKMEGELMRRIYYTLYLNVTT